MTNETFLKQHSDTWDACRKWGTDVTNKAPDKEAWLKSLVLDDGWVSKEEHDVLLEMLGDDAIKLDVIKKAYERAAKVSSADAALKIIAIAMDEIYDIENMK